MGGGFSPRNEKIYSETMCWKGVKAKMPIAGLQHNWKDMRMTKRVISAAAAPLMLMASPAFAAITIDPSTPSGTFENATVTCTSGTTDCSFSDTTTFVTPAGYNLVGGTLTSGPAQTPGQDIFFGPLGMLTGVTLNGQMFNLLATGLTEFATLSPISLTPGATNTLIVSGMVGQSGAGSYAGTLTFGQAPAVPEPATWATMLLGLGATGWLLRRKRSQLHGLTPRFA